MIQTTINIGKWVRGRKEYLSTAEVLAALLVEGIEVSLYAEYVAAHGEPTLVAVTEHPFSISASPELWYVAARLGQDAIAAANTNNWYEGSGILVGPRAEEWGEFDDNLFIMLGGKTLAEKRAAQRLPEPEDGPCVTKNRRLSWCP